LFYLFGSCLCNFLFYFFLRYKLWQKV